MASKARELADVIGTQSTTENVLSGRRNLIINGAMQVSQRGDYTSGVAGYSGGYYLDRWYAARDVVNASLQHTSTSPSGYGNSLKITATSSATGEISSFQKLEGTTVDFIKGKTVTLSAWVRSNTSSARLMVYSGVAWVSLPDAAHTGGGDWEFLTTTFTVPTNAVEQFRPYIAIRNANATSTAIVTGDYIEITQVQLELGSVATPFEHRSYGEELALCQRYFYSELSVANSLAGHVNVTINSRRVAGGGTFPVTMRTTPTTVVYSATNETAGCVSPYNAGTTDSGQGVLYLANPSINGWSYINGTADGFLTVGNFYQYRVTADAEL